MTERSDACLMERYALDDADAFEELFGRYEKRAYGYFLERTRSPERAWDLYQELFLRIHRFRERFDATQPFEPWFFAIARRVHLDDLRRSHRIDAPPESAGAEIEERGSDAEALSIAREGLAQMLGRLSAEQEFVLVAAKLGGFDHAEIAGDLGKSLDAVKQIASRTMRRLRAG